MCVEPNDAERHSLHESDAEISELESEILALKVEFSEFKHLYNKNIWLQQPFPPAVQEHLWQLLALWVLSFFLSDLKDSPLHEFIVHISLQ